MFGPIEVLIIKATPEMIHNWGWFLAFGIVLLLLGVAAVVRSVTSTVVSMVFFGWLLVFASVIEFVDAFMVGKWSGFFLHLLIALLFGAVGVLMLAKPVISAEAVTYVMSIIFLIAGLYAFVGALWTHQPGWGWEAVYGAVTSLLGLFLLQQWPLTGLYAIGLFVGIDLIFYSFGWVTLALDLHKMSA